MEQAPMKLYYFDMPGRAEPIRIMLNHACVKFEDIRISQADWPKMKDSFESKQVPCLECHGKRLYQSYAILLFLAKKYNYFPSCPQGAYSMLTIMNTLDDVITKITMAFSPFSPYDESMKGPMQEEFLKTDLPFFLNYLEQKLKENKTQDFLVGSSISVADFYIMGWYSGLKMFDKVLKYIESSSSQYPVVSNYLEKITKIPPKENKLKLYYFNMVGRAEMIKLLLKHSKIDFDDVQIKMEDWPTLKSKFPLQQVPVLEVNNFQMCETDAIMEFLGTKYKYLPKNPDKLYKVLFLTSSIKDLYEGFVQFFFGKLDEPKKKLLSDEYFSKKAPTLLKAIEKRLKENCSQEYLVDRKYSLADFYFLGAAKWIILGLGKDKFQPIMDTLPLLKVYLEKRLKDF